MKSLELNDNENTTCQNLQDAVKCVLAMFVAQNIYIRKERRLKINKLLIQLKIAGKKSGRIYPNKVMGKKTK